MPPRKAAKLSSISTSRETFSDSDNEEQHNAPAKKWVKQSSRLVDRDVRAPFRYGKKSQFVEEEDEIEILSNPLGNFSISSAQSAHFTAWIESANGVQDETPPDVYDDDHEVDLPSSRDRIPTDDVASDEESSYDQDDEPSTVEHDITDFVAEKEAQVRRSQFATCAITDHAIDQTKALLDWVPLRDSLLDELTRFDGIKAQKECASCAVQFGNEYHALRCSDCLDTAYICERCVRTAHADKPLHRIYVSKYLRLNYEAYAKNCDYRFGRAFGTKSTYTSSASRSALATVV